MTIRSRGLVSGLVDKAAVLNRDMLMEGRFFGLRFYRAARQHLYDLVQQGVTPVPPSRPDGLVIAPATARTTRWDRGAPGWLHPGP